jgi:hypothetical protein
MRGANALGRGTMPEYLFPTGVIRQHVDMMFKSGFHEIPSDTARMAVSAFLLAAHRLLPLWQLSHSALAQSPLEDLRTLVLVIPKVCDFSSLLLDLLIKLCLPLLCSRRFLQPNRTPANRFVQHTTIQLLMCA